jgi:protein arginine kinase
MSIRSLFNSKAELTHSPKSKCPVVLSTRIRLARNLEGYPFPGWAGADVRGQIVELCLAAIAKLPPAKNATIIRAEEISDLEKQILYERHLISRELMSSKAGSGAVVTKDQSCVIMINEEDHLRIQILRNGFNFKRAWSAIDLIDSAIEEQLSYAFSSKIGYLTACPTNLGTGMRASSMMHLPALTLANQMEKVIRAVNQLGIAVRGLFGEGSDASGSIFQISNQTTLGETEEAIIKRLSSVLNTVIEQEMNARAKLMEVDSSKILDKVTRAYGTLRHSFVIPSSEAMNQLSLIRLGIDLEVLPQDHRALVDRLLIECQPGHIQYASKKKKMDSVERDILRAARLREEFAKVPDPDLSKNN